MPKIAIGVTDRINELPLTIESSICIQQRVALVVNVRSLRGRAIQFNDLKVFSASEVIVIRVSDIVSANEKAG